ncbi:deaminase, partial [Sporichthya brevicatena]|uniref:deaminase n=1 Tax=Sporichthya brevicatena TaxID=171442 RepID=UPI0031E416AA
CCHDSHPSWNESLHQTRGDSIRLSSLVDDGGVPADEPEDRRIDRLVTKANDLCLHSNDPARIARLAVAEIVIKRRELAGPTAKDSPPTTPDLRHRIAFVLDSLKRPHEVALLRRVYGERFVLVSFLMDRAERHSALVSRMRLDEPNAPDLDSRAEALLDRDQAEGLPHGQAVGKTYWLADLFVGCSTTQPAALRTPRLDAAAEIRRFLDLLFGNPQAQTPTDDEYGMHLAKMAESRTTALGRRVGAAIVDRDGAVVALGCNEVPRGSATDADKGHDTNATEVIRLAEQTLRGMAEAGMLAPKIAKGLIKNGTSIAREALEVSPLRDLIEFQRPVHAEMAAILDATRRRVDVTDCSMCVTAYCCHLCAKHVLDLGLRPVVYLEPYPKSRAVEMYEEAARTTFVPFVGVAPRRFQALFVDVSERKGHDGTVRSWDQATAVPGVGTVVTDAAVLQAELDEIAELDDNTTATLPGPSDPEHA